MSQRQGNKYGKSRVLKLTSALGAVVALLLVVSASASAAWLHNGHPIDSKGPLDLSGYFAFENESGGVECDATGDLEIDPGNTSASTGTISSFDASDCEATGLLAAFECEVVSAEAAPPFSVAAEKHYLNVGNFEVEFEMNSGCFFGEEIAIEDCPKVVAMPNNPEQINELTLSNSCPTTVGAAEISGVLDVEQGGYGFGAPFTGDPPILLNEGNWVFEGGEEVETLSGWIVFGNYTGEWSCSASAEMSLASWESTLTSLELSGCETSWGFFNLCDVNKGEAQQLPLRVTYPDEGSFEFRDASFDFGLSGSQCPYGDDLEVEEGDIDAVLNYGAAISSMELDATMMSGIGPVEVSGELELDNRPKEFELAPLH